MIMQDLTIFFNPLILNEKNIFEYIEFNVELKFNQT